MKYLKSRFVILFTLLFSIFYFLMPTIGEWIVSDPTYAKYAGKDADRIVSYLQSSFIYPFGEWLKGSSRYFIVIPYYFLLFLTIRYLFGKFKHFFKILGTSTLILFFFGYLFPNTLMIFENNKPSISQGSVSQGSVQNAKRMYFRGENFTTYSYPGYLAGRTFAHDKVRQTMMDSYKICEESCPKITFVVGEIGRKHGGQFLPHRTHRNGMSVDFMTPLLKNEKHYRSHHLFNLWGYRFEFDNKGKKGNVEIDYETMAKHLLALEKTAKQNGLAIQKVIFDPVLRPYLLKTKTGQQLKHLPFTKNRVVIRHDDHYHVDFRSINH